jgi:hypothetical protein
MRINKVTYWFAVAAALMALQGCATLPDTAKAYPPASLIQDCPEPAYTVRTNGQLASAVLALKGALAACNSDKAALRAWSVAP